MLIYKQSYMGIIIHTIFTCMMTFSFIVIVISPFFKPDFYVDLYYWISLLIVLFLFLEFSIRSVHFFIFCPKSITINGSTISMERYFRRNCSVLSSDVVGFQKINEYLGMAKFKCVDIILSDSKIRIPDYQFTEYEEILINLKKNKIKFLGNNDEFYSDLRSIIKYKI